MADANKTEVKTEAKKAEPAEVVNTGGASAAPKQKISEQAAVAVITPETGRLDLSAFKVAKIVTRPVLRLVDNQPIVFRVEEKMFEGKQLEGSKMAPATLMFVTDMLSGRPAQVVVPTVLQSELEEQYPNASYIGKIFAVEKLEKVEGKRYSNYNILELDASNFAR